MTHPPWQTELTNLVAQLMDSIGHRLNQLGIGIRQPPAEADLAAARETIWQDIQNRHFGDRVTAWQGLAHIWSIAYLFLNELPGRTDYLRLSHMGRIGEPNWLKQEPAYKELKGLLDRIPLQRDPTKFKPMHIGYGDRNRILPFGRPKAPTLAPPPSPEPLPVPRPSTPIVDTAQPSKSRPAKPIQTKLFD